MFEYASWVAHMSQKSFFFQKRSQIARYENSVLGKLKIFEMTCTLSHLFDKQSWPIISSGLGK